MKNKLTVEQKLRQYAAENNTVGDVYYTALRFITDIRIKKHYNSEYRTIFFKWLENGSTLDLKTLLAGISYDENNLTHFNAFALLDAVAIK